MGCGAGHMVCRLRSASRRRIGVGIGKEPSGRRQRCAAAAGVSSGPLFGAGSRPAAQGRKRGRKVRTLCGPAFPRVRVLPAVWSTPAGAMPPMAASGAAPTACRGIGGRMEGTAVPSITLSDDKAGAGTAHPRRVLLPAEKTRIPRCGGNGCHALVGLSIICSLIYKPEGPVKSRCRSYAPSTEAPVHGLPALRRCSRPVYWDRDLRDRACRYP